MSMKAERNEALIEAERERRVREKVCAMTNAEYIRYGSAIDAHVRFFSITRQPPAVVRCGVCGRRHEPRLCQDLPKSADDWRIVNAARRSIGQR